MTTIENLTQAITKEEFETIKSVMDRIGCANLITASEFFSQFIGFSYGKYFTHTATIASILTKYIQLDGCNRHEHHAITEYMQSVELVNRTIYAMVEGFRFFEQADLLIEKLDELQYKFEGKTNKS